MLNLAKCVLVKSKLLWPLEAALYSSNIFEIMSYQEFRFQVGLVDGPLGVFFCQSFSLQTVLLKACLLSSSTLLCKYRKLLLIIPSAYKPTRL